MAHTHTRANKAYGNLIMHFSIMILLKCIYVSYTLLFCFSTIKNIHLKINFFISAGSTNRTKMCVKLFLLLSCFTVAFVWSQGTNKNIVIKEFNKKIIKTADLVEDDLPPHIIIAKARPDGPPRFGKRQMLGISPPRFGRSQMLGISPPRFGKRGMSSADMLGISPPRFGRAYGYTRGAFYAGKRFAPTFGRPTIIYDDYYDKK